MEEHPKYFPLTKELMAAIDAGQKVAFTSPITLVEVLTKPYEKGDHAVAQEYRRRLVENPQVRSRPIDSVVADEAARIRAVYRVKRTPDAIQLASAKLQGADVFLTNDRELKRFTELPVLLLEECLEGDS